MMRIAFIAHDEQKPTLIEFADEHTNLLEQFDCMATRSTGEQLNQETDLEVEQLESGSRGGDMMIGAAVVSDDCDAVIFLRDPLTAQPHEPDIMAPCEFVMSTMFHLQRTLRARTRSSITWLIE